MGNGRIAYIDRIRVLLTCLVVLHHTSIAYGGAGGWYFAEPTGDDLTPTKAILSVFTGVNQSFFMGMFFLISAYFMPGSFDRKGPGKFLGDRFIRLGIPMVVYVALIGPGLLYYINARDDMSFWTYYSDNVLTLKVLNFGPLWFVEALLYMAIIYVGFRWLAKGNEETWRPRAFPGNGAIAFSALIVGLAAFAIRLFYPTGQDFLGLQFGYFASYIFLFVIGIIAYRHGWFEQIPRAVGRRWGIVAICMVPVLPVAIVLYEALGWGPADDMNGGWNILAVIYAMWEPFIGFGIILWLMRWFRDRWNGVGEWSRKLGNDSYTAYIIHAPVVVALTYLLLDVSLPAMVKFGVAGSVAVILSFGLGSLTRAIPGMKRVL